jgi:hypothetical protein
MAERMRNLADRSASLADRAIKKADSVWDGLAPSKPGHLKAAKNHSREHQPSPHQRKKATHEKGGF